ncbi:hypothetical protein EMIT0P171_150005 [Pseudomonas sp. IT-P171]
MWRGSLLPLECVALTKLGNSCQIFGAATQPSASKLARHKGMHDSRARLSEQHYEHVGAFLYRRYLNNSE